MYVLYLAFALLALASAKDFIKVYGRLTCAGDADKAKKVKVHLVDVDRMRPDECIDKGKSDNGGTFELEGKGSDPFGKIDPQLKIYHRCDDHNPCYRRKKITIPDSCIDVKAGCDLGTIKLELHSPDEEHTCFPHC